MDLSGNLIFSFNALRYALVVTLGVSALWFIGPRLGDRTPIWAIISFLVVSDPKLGETTKLMWQRLANTLVGSATAMVFVMIFGPSEWVMPVAVAATSMVCMSLVKMPSNWKLAPATAAIVLFEAKLGQSRITGLETALRRTMEVVVGSLLAVALSSLILQHDKKADADASTI